jgi:4'-phosphopantetheinyl transferase
MMATAPPAAEWPVAAEPPALGAGEVHVWLCSTDADAVADELLGALSAAERARADRFEDRAKGRAWARSRALLRTLLAAYAGTPPAGLSLRTSPAGKPSLRSGPYFSLAHSGTLALYAFSAAGEVGVDIEAARPRRRELARLAERAFGGEQAARLRTLAPAERELAFLRLWTRREARLKYLSGRRGPEPWLSELALGADAVAALALSAPPGALLCLRRR